MFVPARLAAPLALLLSVGCGVREVTPNPYVQRAPTAVRAIAVDPAGGAAAEAVGRALAARGYAVVMAPASGAFPADPDDVRGWSALRSIGVDALLAVTGDRPDGPERAAQPERLSATIRHADGGAVVASAVWKTRFADQIGTTLDRATGRTRDDVAAHIAEALALQLAR